MVTLSVIVPATDQPATLARCLDALRAGSDQPDELTVVDSPHGHGPAAARNQGAQRAAGDVLVFVDADVEAHRDALARIRRAFNRNPNLSAVFGSYDDDPGSAGLISDFRNLLHHHVHHEGAGEAMTFWAGLGAVRRADLRRQEVMEASTKCSGFSATSTKVSLSALRPAYLRPLRRPRIIPCWRLRRLGLALQGLCQPAN